MAGSPAKKRRARARWIISDYDFFLRALKIPLRLETNSKRNLMGISEEKNTRKQKELRENDHQSRTPVRFQWPAHASCRQGHLCACVHNYEFISEEAC